MKKNLLHLASKLHMTQEIAYDFEEKPQFAAFVKACCTRFLNGDWGDITDDDKELNDGSFEHKSQIVASYNFPPGLTIENEEKIWIIAAAGHSYGTVLYPNEY